MVAKLALRVCPVPGCVTISSKDGVCPAHPHKNLVREVYEHCPKDGSRPGDLGGVKKSPFDLGNMGDLLDGLFGSDRPGGKS
jgi:hypothetical protein